MKVVFRMVTPVALTYPWVHFDAILAHLWLRKNYEGYRSLPSKRVVDLDMDLPLKKTGDIYHASVSFFDVSDAYTTKIYKRFCEKHLNLKRIRQKKIDRSRGHFKDFAISLTYIPARTVTFYAYGEIEEVEGLLRGLAGIGKKVAIGFGFYRDSSVEPIDEDYSVVKDGKAARPIPVDMVEEAEDVAMLAYRPPYWDRRRMKPCVPPGCHLHIKNQYSSTV